MAKRALAARAMLGAPDVEHVDGQVFLRLRLMNVGGRALSKLQITGIGLGGARRTSPAGLPVVISGIDAGAAEHLSARFSSDGLIVGATYQLSLSGSYVVDGVACGLTLQRAVQIPAAGAAALPGFKARLESSTSAHCWDYTLFNDEPADSAGHIASFSLFIAAPVAVSGTPAGWEVETDGASYVLWFAADYARPYPCQVAPGRSLAGFQLTAAGRRSEAAPAALTAWDHATDDVGLAVVDYAMTPYRFA